MNDPWMLAFVIALFALQLFLCAKARRVWLRLLPLLVLLALIAACVILYICSGYTNWAFLILLLLLGAMVAVDGFAWLFWGILRLLYRHEKNRSV
jgi:hypothetical protein